MIAVRNAQDGFCLQGKLGDLLLSSSSATCLDLKVRCGHERGDLDSIKRMRLVYKGRSLNDEELVNDDVRRILRGLRGALCIGDHRDEAERHRDRARTFGPPAASGLAAAPLLWRGVAVWCYTPPDHLGIVSHRLVGRLG